MLIRHGCSYSDDLASLILTILRVCNGGVSPEEVDMGQEMEAEGSTNCISTLGSTT